MADEEKRDPEKGNFNAQRPHRTRNIVIIVVCCLLAASVVIALAIMFSKQESSDLKAIPGKDVAKANETEIVSSKSTTTKPSQLSDFVETTDNIVTTANSKTSTEFTTTRSMIRARTTAATKPDTTTIELSLLKPAATIAKTAERKMSRNLATKLSTEPSVQANATSTTDATITIINVTKLAIQSIKEVGYAINLHNYTTPTNQVKPTTIIAASNSNSAILKTTTEIKSRVTSIPALSTNAINPVTAPEGIPKLPTSVNSTSKPESSTKAIPSRPSERNHTSIVVETTTPAHSHTTTVHSAKIGTALQTTPNQLKTTPNMRTNTISSTKAKLFIAAKHSAGDNTPIKPTIATVANSGITTAKDTKTSTATRPKSTGLITVGITKANHSSTEKQSTLATTPISEKPSSAIFTTELIAIIFGGKSIPTRNATILKPTPRREPISTTQKNTTKPTTHGKSIAVENSTTTVKPFLGATKITERATMKTDTSTAQPTTHAEAIITRLNPITEADGSTSITHNQLVTSPTKTEKSLTSGKTITTQTAESQIPEETSSTVPTTTITTAYIASETMSHKKSIPPRNSTIAKPPAHENTISTTKINTLEPTTDRKLFVRENSDTTGKSFPRANVTTSAPKRNVYVTNTRALDPTKSTPTISTNTARIITELPINIAAKSTRTSTSAAGQLSSKLPVKKTSKTTISTPTSTSTVRSLSKLMMEKEGVYLSTKAQGATASGLDAKNQETLTTSSLLKTTDSKARGGAPVADIQ